MNMSTGTEDMRGCLSRTLAHDQWPEARVFVDRIPRTSIGPIPQTEPRTMLSGWKCERREPQPAAASKDWHVKPMEKK